MPTFQSFVRGPAEKLSFARFLASQTRMEKATTIVRSFATPLERAVADGSTILQYASAGRLVQSGEAGVGQATALMGSAAGVGHDTQEMIASWRSAQEKAQPLAKASPPSLPSGPACRPPGARPPRSRRRRGICARFPPRSTPTRGWRRRAAPRATSASRASSSSPGSSPSTSHATRRHHATMPAPTSPAACLAALARRYPEREVLVLQGASFEVHPGQVLGMTGSAGCGKSTALRLLERFYDVTDGRILLDGKDIRDYSPDWLRAQIATVAQEPKLLPFTIRENIAYPDLGLEPQTGISPAGLLLTHTFRRRHGTASAAPPSQASSRSTRRARRPTSMRRSWTRTSSPRGCAPR